MPREPVSSWGNVLRAEHDIVAYRSRHDPFPVLEPGHTLLAYGNGRSYGDSCLNADAGLVRMRALDRYIAFDPLTGIFACEAGMLLDEILQRIVPEGWFLPVVPGTRFVTVGGAIANDVHGKNHHTAGTFIRHVRRFELLRSDGQRIVCSDSQNAEWFAATAGGLGLTGLITWVELQLRRIPGRCLQVETLRFENFNEFLTLAAQSDRQFEYTVGWVDCLARGRRLGRGVLQRASHGPGPPDKAPRRPRTLRVPFRPPFSLLNTLSVRAFNTLHYHLSGAAGRRTDIDLERFFFPLDAIQGWNRLYGRRGLYQYQCVIPEPHGREAIPALLDTLSRSGRGSFLAVMKVFGSIHSPGMLSFPQPGITLALDFPNSGPAVRRLFLSLDAILRSVGGRLYPAKDARMPCDLFRDGYPRLEEFSRYVDPHCSSSFWRRVMEEA